MTINSVVKRMDADAVLDAAIECYRRGQITKSSLDEQVSSLKRREPGIAPRLQSLASRSAPGRPGIRASLGARSG
jgi:hypothetical protein